MRSLALLPLLLSGCAQPMLELEASDLPASAKASARYLGVLTGELTERGSGDVYDFELDLYRGSGSSHWALMSVPVGEMFGAENEWGSILLRGVVNPAGKFRFQDRGATDWSVHMTGTWDSEAREAVVLTVVDYPVQDESEATEIAQSIFDGLAME